jgi:hypothetical protein
MAGGSAPAPWVAFLCLPKEKRRKERAPPGLRPPTPRVPSCRARLRGCADATSLSRRHTLATPRSPLRARTSSSRVTRLDQGVFKTQLTSRAGVTDRKVFSGPRSRRRASPPESGAASLVFEPEGEAEHSWKSGGLPCRRTDAPRIGAPQVHAPGELGERRFRREAQEAVGGSGGPSLL